MCICTNVHVCVYTHIQSTYVISESGWERREGGREGGTRDTHIVHTCVHTHVNRSTDIKVTMDVQRKRKEGVNR